MNTFKGHIIHDNEVSIINSSFINNTVIIYSNNTHQFDGGIIYFNYNYIHSIILTDHTYHTTWNILQITSSIFNGAYITGNGGAICIDYNQKYIHHPFTHDTTAKYINISHSQFWNNQALNGSAIKMDQLQWIFFNMEHTDFYNNTAKGNMGTIYINAADGTDININDCHFEENMVSNGNGAGLYINIIPSSNHSMYDMNNNMNRRRMSRDLLSINNNNSINITISPTAQPTLTPTEFITTSNPTKTTENINPTISPTQSPTFSESVNECPQINIIDTSFYANNAFNGYGAGIYIQQYAKLRCLDILHRNTSFTYNTAKEGAGFYLNRIDYTKQQYIIKPNSSNIIFDKTQFNGNWAIDGSGGGIYISTDIPDISCNAINLFNIEFTDCLISNSFSNRFGGGAYIKCAEIRMDNTEISGNRIKVSQVNEAKECSTSECLETLANDFMDSFGGRGAGIYLYSASIIITNNIFNNNSINLGNGGGLFFHIIDNTEYNYLQKQHDMKLIITDNIISNNEAEWNLTVIDREPECTDFSGLSGFGGGFWIQIGKKYNINDVTIKNNKFIDNDGLFIKHLYYDLFYRESISTIRKILADDSTNIYKTNNNKKESNSSQWVQYDRGTSPINFTKIELLDGVSGEECDSNSIGCIGYVLPGDTSYRTSLKLIDYFNQQTTPFLGCSHLIYNLSTDLEMTQLTLVDIDDNHLSIEFHMGAAEYLSIEYINISDTHYMITSNIWDKLKSNQNISYYTYHYSSYHVIATLCSAGQEVSISTEGITICDNQDMAGVSFQCKGECGQQEYLFTRWEPSCHPCPKGGVICSGENIVVIDYANYAKVTQKLIANEDTPDDYICSMEFNVYLCPAELCCTDIAGCSFNGFVDENTNFCAKNRDPSTNFCGKCLNGYSELIGSYECGICDENRFILLFIPIIVCFILEIYLILRNPFIVTPLFTYVYKSLLYFYQILPILTYESYLSLVFGIINVFDLSVLTSFGQGGTCLFAKMSAVNKLWVNFIIPLILLIELIILRLIPEILDWCKSRKTLMKQLNNNNNNDFGFEYFSFNDEEDEEDKSIQFEASYDPTMHTSIYDESMGAGLLENDTLNEEPVLLRNRNKLASYQLIRSHISRQNKFDLSQRVREHYKEAFWNTLLIMYIVVCQSSIKMFNCAKVDKQSYLWYAGEYKCYQVWNYIFIVIFCILLLFPFYIIYCLWKLRGSLSQWRRIKYAAFTMSYRRKCWYYEAVMMFRRIILISVYAFPKGNQYLLRAIIAFFCGIILAIHVKVQPFRYKINNHLETLLLLLLFLVSTLSTVSDTTGLNLKYPTSAIAIIPLLFLPYLAFRYCRDGVVPKVKNIINTSNFSSISTKNKKNIININNEQYLNDDDEDDDDDEYLNYNDDDIIHTTYHKQKKQPLTDDYNEYIAPQLELTSNPSNISNIANISNKSNKTNKTKKKENVIDSFDIKHKKPNYLEHSISSESTKKQRYSSLIKKHTLTKTDNDKYDDDDDDDNDNDNDDDEDDEDDDLYKNIPLKNNQQYVVIGDDGQIELALYNGNKPNDNNNNNNNNNYNHKPKGSWYNIFNSTTNRERSISKQYEEAEKQQKREAKEKEKISKKRTSGIMSNLYSSLKKNKKSTVSEQGDYDLSVNVMDNDDNDDGDNDIVGDLFLSPAAKRKKAAEKLKRKQQIETEKEMQEFSKASTVITPPHHHHHHHLDSNPDISLKYNSLGDHTLFSQTLINDNNHDDENQSNFLELINFNSNDSASISKTKTNVSENNNNNNNENQDDNEQYVQ